MRKNSFIKILILPLFLSIVLSNGNEIYKKAILQPGEQIFFSNYIFKLNNIKSEARDNHYAFISDIDIIENNNHIKKLKAERRIYFYWKEEEERKNLSEWVSYTFEKIPIIEDEEVPIELIEQIEISILFQKYDAQSNVGTFNFKITTSLNIYE